MTETIDWRTDGVKIVRAESLRKAMVDSGIGRATAFDFAGAAGRETWIGTVTLAPNARTGGHHHRRHEVAVYVVKGRGKIRWGDRLEFTAEVGVGDFVYFAPFVPHQELNVANEPLDFVVVRSDKERIAVSLDIAPVDDPERIDN